MKQPLFSASCAPQSSCKESWEACCPLLSWPSGRAGNLHPPLGLVLSKPERCLPPMEVRLGVTGRRCLAPRPPAPVRTPWHPWPPLLHPPSWATRSPLPLSSLAPLPLPLLPPDHGCIHTTPRGPSAAHPSPLSTWGVIFHALQAPPVMLRGQMISDLVTRTAAPCTPHQLFPQTPAGGLCPSQGFSLSRAGSDPWADLSLEGASRRGGARHSTLMDRPGAAFVGRLRLGNRSC